jgi:hypothetical protein
MTAQTLRMTAQTLRMTEWVLGVIVHSGARCSDRYASMLDCYASIAS